MARRALNTSVLGAASLLALAACESQVGHEYTGEVQFTMQGQVNVDPGANLVPRLGFYAEGGIQLVDGVVTGEFPRRFRFEVTQPPPESTLIVGEEATGTSDGRLALGFVVMMPPDAPSFVPDLTTDTDSECDDFGTCVHEEVRCNAEGACQERTLECKMEACELIGEVGDPALEAEAGLSQSTAYNTGTAVYATLSACNTEGSCYRRHFACDLESLGDFDTAWSSGEIERCSLVEQHGDSSLKDARDIRTAAAGFIVIFSTREVPDFPLGPLKRGYNLIQHLELPPEELLTAAFSCDPDDPTDCSFNPPARIVGAEEVSIDLGRLPG